MCASCSSVRQCIQDDGEAWPTHRRTPTDNTSHAGQSAEAGLLQVLLRPLLCKGLPAPSLLAVFDGAVFGAAVPVAPKFISSSNPASR